MSDVTKVKTRTERLDAENSGTRKSRRTGLLILLLVVLLAAAGIVAYSRIFLEGYQSTDDASVSGDRSVVSSQIPGRVLFLGAESGKQVAKGEVIARLDDETLRALANQGAANEELAARGVALAQVKVEQAQADFNRGTLQYRNSIISREQYDHLRAALTEGEAEYDIALAQSKMAAAQSATARANLGHASITAAQNGIVARRWVNLGDVVQPAQPIYTIYNLSELWVNAYFKETQLRYLKAGDAAQISVDAYPGLKIHGRILSLGTATASEFALMGSDSGSGNFTKVTQRIPVKIAIDNLSTLEINPESRLLPGMSVEVRIQTGKE